MGGWLSFLWGFIIVFVGGVIIYQRMKVNLEIMLDEKEDWLD